MSSDCPTHVFIYGPPAAGKLTVATALAARRRFRLLDNHASLDLGLRLFEFGDPRLTPLVVRLRAELIGAAAAAGLDVVSTLAFAHPGDRDHVRSLVAATEDRGGRVVFVQLLPSRAALDERVIETSRKAFQKIATVALLDEVIGRHDLVTPINTTDLVIDNSNLSPEVVVDRIVSHYELFS
jgi:hypothetical protein